MEVRAVPVGPSWAFLNRLGGIVGASWGHLGTSLEHLGRILEAKFKEVQRGEHKMQTGALLERSWTLLGRSWAVLGSSWGRLGAVLAPSWGRLDPPWGRLGTVLEPTPVSKKTYKNQGFGTILERRCSKMLCFTMVFEHFYLSDVLTFLGLFGDRLGSQLPQQKNDETNTFFIIFRSRSSKTFKMQWFFLTLLQKRPLEDKSSEDHSEARFWQDLLSIIGTLTSRE